MNIENGSFCIKADEIVLEDSVLHNGFISIADEKIHNISTSEQEGNIVEYPNSLLLPGFIDLHTHGRLGISTNNVTDELLINYARTGTTALLATLSDNVEEMVQVMQKIKDHSPSKASAKILGIHAEGPFIDQMNRGGVNKDVCCEPDKKKLDALLSVGNLKYITVSPYVNGVSDAVEYLSQAGVVCVSGHSRGNKDIFLNTVNKGIKGICHWYNNNPPEQLMLETGVRNPVLCDYALLNDDIFLEIICDLQHVHPVFIELAYKLKGSGKIAVISDSINISGLPEGIYDYIDGRKIELKKEGIHEVASGIRFGSSTTQIQEFINLVKEMGIPICDAARMCALTPAEILKADKEIGSIFPGKKADLIVLDKDTFDLLQVFVPLLRFDP